MDDPKGYLYINKKLFYESMDNAERFMFEESMVMGPSPTAPLELSSDRKLVNCPSCNKEATTEIHYESGRLTWLLCIIMFFLG